MVRRYPLQGDLMKHIEFGRGLPVGMACMLLAMALSPVVAAQQATPSSAAAAANQAEVAAPAAKHLDLTHVIALLRTRVPDLAGKTEQEARSLLASPDVNLVLKVTGNQGSSATPGTILSQTPAAATEVLKGSTVEVTVAQAAPANPVPAQQLMPSLIGVSAQQAALTMRQMELPVRISDPEYSTQFAAGVISAQDPAAGTPISRGDSVNRTVVQLGISKGPPPAPPPPTPATPPNPLPPAHELRTVPDLGRMTPQQAEAALLRAGLRLGAMTSDYSDSVGTGLILGQAPAAGTRVDREAQDTVSAVLSRGAAPLPPPPRRLWPVVGIGVGLVLLAAAAWMIRKWLRPKLPVRITAASHRAPAAVTVRQSSQRQPPDVRLRTRLLPGTFRLLREPQIHVSRDAATSDKPRNQQ